MPNITDTSNDLMDYFFKNMDVIAARVEEECQAVPDLDIVRQAIRIFGRGVADSTQRNQLVEHIIDDRYITTPSQTEMRQMLQAAVYELACCLAWPMQEHGEWFPDELEQFRQ